MTTYTIQELLADEGKRRKLAGEVLKPGPWKHEWRPDEINRPCGEVELSTRNWHCAKPCCGAKQSITGSMAKVFFIPARLDRLHPAPCPVPDADERPMEVLAEELITLLHGRHVALLDAIWKFYHTIHIWLKDDTECWEWFATTGASNRCVICLLALGAAVVTKETAATDPASACESA